MSGHNKKGAQRAVGLLCLIFALIAGILSALNFLGQALVFGLLSVTFVGIALWILPKGQVALLREQQDDIKPVEAFEIENKSREMLAKALGGLGILLTLATTVQQMQRTALTEQRSVATAATERLYKAADKVGSAKSSDRSGALADLQRMVGEGLDVAPVAVSVLCGYVRDVSPSSLTVTPDPKSYADRSRELEEKLLKTGDKRRIQAVIDSIARRPESVSEVTIDLSQTSLALNVKFHPVGPRERSNWNGADFTLADLTYADFRNCDLKGAAFVGARLEGATFEGADLTGAVFLDAEVTGMNVTHARGITGDSLTGASGDLKSVVGLPGQSPSPKP